MSPLPQLLIEFVNNAKLKFGEQAANYNNFGAFVTAGGYTAHVVLDQNSNRAVVWTELERPERANFAMVERAAAHYTWQGLFRNGTAIGINRAADMVLLGRSFDQDALGSDEGVRITLISSQRPPSRLPNSR